MLAPLMPSEPRCPHDICHSSCITATGRSFPGQTVRGISPFVLRPQPVQNPAEIRRGITLRRPPRVAFQRAPICRPRKRHHVVVKVTRTVLGRERGSHEAKQCKQAVHFDLSKFHQLYYIPSKFPDNANPAVTTVCPDQGRGKGLSADKMEMKDVR